MKANLTLIFLLAFQSLTAQVLVPVDSIHFSFSSDEVIFDQLGNVYLSDSKGRIVQYSIEEASTRRYGPNNSGRCEGIHAQAAGKLLVFYPDLQEIHVLDRFMGLETVVDLSELLDGYYSRMATGTANTIYLLSSDFIQVVQLDLGLRSVIRELVIEDLVSKEVEDFRIVKDQFYFLTEDEIVILNDRGEITRRVLADSKNLSFRRENLVWIRDNELFFLYPDFNVKEKIKVPARFRAQKLLIDEDLYYFFFEDYLLVYREE